MWPSLQRALLAMFLVIPPVLVAEEGKDEEALPGDQTEAQREVRVWSNEGGREMTFQIDSEGQVSLEVTEEAEGKDVEKTYEAESWDAFKEKYPEVVREYRLERYVSRDSWAEDVLGPLREGLLALGGPRFGIRAVPVGESLAAQLGLEPDVGILVASVQAGSLAERTGVLAHDVIVSLNGEPVGNLGEFRRRIREAIPRGFTILVIRKGERLELPAQAEPKG